MHSPEKRIATSVLVIGTGGSGLRAAIELAERGVGVMAVGKRPKADAHTSLAAGGINAVFGACGFDLTDGSRYVIHADAVILAAGGHTRIWRRISSRRDESTGDSFRLAVLAGCRIRDPELVQFHPSGLIAPENAAGTLVSEAARGESGILRNQLGERFMSRYDPKRMELSTRDRIALAAYTEIKEGRGTAERRRAGLMRSAQPAVGQRHGWSRHSDH